MPSKETNEEVQSEEEVAPQEEMVVPQEEVTVPQEEVVAPKEEVVIPQEEEIIPQEPEVAPQEEETIPQEEVVPQVEETTPQVEEEIDQPEPPIVEFVDEDEDEPVSGQPWWKWLLVMVLGVLIGFAGGFFVGKYYPELTCCDNSQEQEMEYEPEEVFIDSLALDSTKTVSADSIEIAKDTTEAAPVDTLKKVEKDKETPKPVVDQSYKKYDEMDQRVRTGAYAIVGLDQVVKAREGDNLARVSRRYLGEGMSCYVEVYNGMTATTELKAGQEVKLPKLKLKKLLKE